MAPSVVLLGDDGVVVGKQAIAAASLEPENVWQPIHTIAQLADCTAASQRAG